MVVKRSTTRRTRRNAKANSLFVLVLVGVVLVLLGGVVVVVTKIQGGNL